MPIEILKADPGRGTPIEPVRLRTIVSSRQAEAEREARLTVAEAQERALVLIEAAHAEAEALGERERLRGRASGEARFAEAALELAQVRRALFAEREREGVTLAVEIARQIVGASLAADSSLVVDVAARLCAPLRRDAGLTLRVSPAEAAQAAALAQRLGDGRAVVVDVDPALAPGDCVVDCAGVRVDGRVEIQMAAIEQRLLAAVEEERRGL